MLGARPDAPATPEAHTVRLGLNWYPEPEFGGFYAASTGKLWERHRLAVEIVPGGPGVPVLEMLQSGKLDAAVAGADDLLTKRAHGLDAVAVFASFQHSPVGLMSHAGGPAKIEDVKGPVAIEQGSPFQLFLWSKLGWEGKVAMVPSTGSIGPFAADPALVQQAYVTSEPCVAESKGIAVQFMPGRDAGWDPYSGLVVVRGADAKAPWVKDLVEASREGWEAYLRDPASANAEIVKQNPALAAEQMPCITGKQRDFITGDAPVGSMTAARWDEAAAALALAGQQVRSAGAWVQP